MDQTGDEASDDEPDYTSFDDEEYDLQVLDAGDHTGLSFGQAREDILWLADGLGLPGVFQRAKRACRAPAFIEYDGRPSGGYVATPQDEALLDEVLGFFVARWSSGEDAADEAALETAEWTDRLDALLRRAAVPWLQRIAAAPPRAIDGSDEDAGFALRLKVMAPLERFVVAAFRLLPERLTAGWGTLWTEQVGGRGLEASDESRREILEHLARRTATHEGFADALLRRRP